MLTSPDNLWSPDTGTEFKPTIDTAAMQDSVQAALNGVRTQLTTLRVTVLDFTIPEFTDATLASTAITTSVNQTLTTDQTFILTRQGTRVTVTSGLYLVSMGFASTAAGVNFTGRSFAEIEGAAVGLRNTAPPNVLENSVGLLNQIPIPVSGGSIEGRIYKITGQTSPVSGRMVITKLY